MKAPERKKKCGTWPHAGRAKCRIMLTAELLHPRERGEAGPRDALVRDARHQTGEVREAEMAPIAIALPRAKDHRNAERHPEGLADLPSADIARKDRVSDL